ncbi:MAG: C39 family peptidase [Clostridiaceae bacterium]
MRKGKISLIINVAILFVLFVISANNLIAMMVNPYFKIKLNEISNKSNALLSNVSNSINNKIVSITINEAKLTSDAKDEIDASKIDNYKITNVPKLNQHPKLKTGCEITATTIVLNYIGIDIDMETLAAEIPKSSIPYIENGLLIGGDPNQYFIGDPFSNSGYGVYHKPIYDLLTSYTPNVIDLTGKSFDEIISNITKGNPVIAWATLNMDPIIYNKSWYIDETLFNWKGKEHSYVIVGYSKDTIIVNDPNSGEEKSFDKDLFIKRWSDLGSQAIAVYK